MPRLRATRRLMVVALGITAGVIMSTGPASADLLTNVTFGNPGDVPLAGDWNDIAADQVVVYRPGNRTFYPGED
ncbi:hypothetical protein [Streptomyces sp. NPDC058155]|uniref:hypothetical protein n=1 Tax=Streptomyces sp. NPDC058155 TaxID=3346359 RepID=UPI0036EE413E